jgi:hypothetical protein
MKVVTEQVETLALDRDDRRLECGVLPGQLREDAEVSGGSRETAPVQGRQHGVEHCRHEPDAGW